MGCTTTGATAGFAGIAWRFTAGLFFGAAVFFAVVFFLAGGADFFLAADLRAADLRTGLTFLATDFFFFAAALIPAGFFAGGGFFAGLRFFALAISASCSVLNRTAGFADGSAC